MAVDVFMVVADSTRRRILDELVDREQSVGELVGTLGLSQPTVSKHLKVLRDNGFTTVRADGQRRLYAVDSEALRDVDQWLSNFRRFWTPPLDALATEIARGKRGER